ncbi:hypothetical protein [Actinomadura rayongensis]|uniref:Uncharacterized protein n=1 Tax=Actinomadura rayongensis TaxID=1429076 RepID=A0A6I4W4U1_9ACTN|nr:hypothetical protein [Actinomadura rayongensis]MXQ65207.1 hypothetical protein [Actinomadura rayongensis]
MRISSTDHRSGTSAESPALDGVRNARLRVALNRLADALGGLGGMRWKMSAPHATGMPFLVVTGVGEGRANLSETVRARVADDGTIAFVWSWGDDIAGRGDAGAAARAVARVLDPRM